MNVQNILILGLIIYISGVVGVSTYKFLRKNVRNNRGILITGGVDVYQHPMGNCFADYMLFDDEDSDTALAGRKKYIVLEDIEGGNLYRTLFNNYLVLGRLPGHNEGQYLSITKRGISAQHCCIYEERGYTYIDDLHSTNHTFHNGKIVSEPTPISENDVISLGNTRLIFHIMTEELM